MPTKSKSPAESLRRRLVKGGDTQVQHLTGVLKGRYGSMSELKDFAGARHKNS